MEKSPRSTRLYSDVSVLSVHNLKAKQQEIQADRYKAILTVIGGFLYMSFLGCQYVVGTISPYLALYFDVDSSATQLILPLIFVTNIFVMPVGSQLAIKMNPKVLLTIGSLIFAPMTIASTMVTSFGAFLPLFSVGFGICNGLTYMVPMQHGWLWYPERPGLISGIIIGGFGIGTFVFCLVSEHLVNPEGISSDDQDYEQVVIENVPRMMMVLAICNIATAIASILLIFSGPDPSSVAEVAKTLSQNAPSRTVSGDRAYLIA
mmetsp:Transcript_20878/g.25633  ORF Transcript_20878/g.25633 Transcript_20878/m.25633 type:complete len:262 (-) Transcript_20878:1209-1994(-)|eukprot:CAMPEP_0170457468 /NCGR_PEP_ID=MMETSP0123-20130129/4748_1 /TAXON_ID=182087 /ORGANISM="Favella ehrenbergii, Strain Fehren 1" /LENGTH=261 /DNA_ID=CAMNT_0010721267 /DNA_START=21 /DNA_END=806 /DNA_ORIENTATION=+